MIAVYTYALKEIRGHAAVMIAGTPLDLRNLHIVEPITMHTLLRRQANAARAAFGTNILNTNGQRDDELGGVL